MSKASRPEISVTCLRLLRSTRLMVILEVASSSARRASEAAALEAFFFASFSARFWASRERVERLAATASVEGSAVSRVIGGVWWVQRDVVGGVAGSGEVESMERTFRVELGV